MSKKKSYTKISKQEVVEYFRAHPEKTGKEVGELFGFKPDMVNRWKREEKVLKDKSFPGHGNPINEQQMQDRKTIARLTEENEILNKAMAIFSRKIL